MEAKLLHTTFEEGKHLFVNGDTAATADIAGISATAGIASIASHKTVADERKEMSGHEVTQDFKFC